VDLNFYRFTSTWLVPGAPVDAYAALETLDDYPEWWPEVKEARKLDENRFEVRCRSLLPYDLVFTSEQAVRDPETKVLEATLRGDLDGFTRWTIQGSHGGSRLVFEEEVTANKRSLRALAPVARPAFRANHYLMMRHGERGLRTYLAGYRLARRTPTS
jgi:Polyketide cyclase / dehydrase and lipid transport